MQTRAMRREGRPTPVWTKVPLAGLACLLATGWMGAGCADANARRDAHQRAVNLIPPPVPSLISGPVALLLTSGAGFSCHVNVREGSDPNAEPLIGELFGYTNKLFFAPSPLAFGRRPGGFGFLYDVDQARGFLLCDVMQGYAPVSTRFAPTNVTVRAVGRGVEKVAGHPCETVEVTFDLAGAPSQTLRVWRATDLQRFPVRIASTEGRPFDMTLTRVILEAPPVDMFVPPDGFARYESPEGMMAEMVMRQEKLKRKPNDDLVSPEINPRAPGSGMGAGPGAGMR